MSTSIEAQKWGSTTPQAQGGFMVPKKQSSAQPDTPASPPEPVAPSTSTELEEVEPALAVLVAAEPATDPGLELVVVEPPPPAPPQPPPELWLAPNMTFASMVNVQLARQPAWFVRLFLLVVGVGASAAMAWLTLR